MAFSEETEHGLIIVDVVVVDGDVAAISVVFDAIEDNGGGKDGTASGRSDGIGGDDDSTIFVCLDKFCFIFTIFCFVIGFWLFSR